MSWQEWRDTPWWVQRAYIEGMQQEELLEVSRAPSPEEPKHWEQDPVSAPDQEYLDMGLKVIRGSV